MNRDASKGEMAKKYSVVAEWKVPIIGKVHHIEFEHGTTSGRRVVRVDGEEIIRHDWMFKLVGDNSFRINGIDCIIRVIPAEGFNYDYLLYVDGKPLQKFTKKQENYLKLWKLKDDTEEDIHVILERDSLAIYVNGEQMDEKTIFVDGGTDAHFKWRNKNLVIKGRSTSCRHKGIIYSLCANGEVILDGSF